MYKFVVPLNDQTYDYLYEEYGEHESSDISEIIGMVILHLKENEKIY